MKYDDKYPMAREFDEPEPGIIRVRQQRPCWHCASLTRWADIDFGAYLCSDECSAAKWQEFERAYRGSKQNGQRGGPL